MLRNAIKDVSDIQLKRRASEFLTKNVCICTPSKNYYAFVFQLCWWRILKSLHSFISFELDQWMSSTIIIPKKFIWHFKIKNNALQIQFWQMNKKKFGTAISLTCHAHHIAQKQQQLGTVEERNKKMTHHNFRLDGRHLWHTSFSSTL